VSLVIVFAAAHAHAQSQPASLFADAPPRLFAPQVTEITWRNVTTEPIGPPAPAGSTAGRAARAPGQLFMGTSGCTDPDALRYGSRREQPFAVGVQHFAAMKASPGLTLVGFSEWGCGVDAAMGFGIAYTKPLTKTVSFRLTFGGFYMPYATPWNGAAYGSSAHADLFVDQGGGRYYRIGVSKMGFSYSRVF
jgi:hypothetical protein